MAIAPAQTGYYDIEAVANEFLAIPGAMNAVSPMKIQKLVYYAHGWHLALRDAPLVAEPVHAWPYGPVFISLYEEFSEFGKSPISRFARDLKSTGEGLEEYIPRLESGCFAVGLVRKIWQLIGSFTGIQLSTLTHQPGSPWHQVASRFGGKPPGGVRIPDALIKDYFLKQLSK